MWHHWLSTLSPLPTHLTNIFIKHFLVNISTHWSECNFNKQDHLLLVIFWRENNKIFLFILKPLLFLGHRTSIFELSIIFLVKYCQGNLLMLPSITLEAENNCLWHSLKEGLMSAWVNSWGAPNVFIFWTIRFLNLGKILCLITRLWRPNDLLSEQLRRSQGVQQISCLLQDC